MTPPLCSLLHCLWCSVQSTYHIVSILICCISHCFFCSLPSTALVLLLYGVFHIVFIVVTMQSSIYFLLSTILFLESFSILDIVSIVVWSLPTGVFSLLNLFYCRILSTSLFLCFVLSSSLFLLSYSVNIIISIVLYSQHHYFYCLKLSTTLFYSSIQSVNSFILSYSIYHIVSTVVLNLPNGFLLSYSVHHIVSIVYSFYHIVSFALFSQPNWFYCFIQSTTLFLL